MRAKPKPSRRTARSSRTAATKASPSDGTAVSRVIREMPARMAAPAAAKSGGDPVERRGKYVYCVIRSEESLRFGTIGLGNVPADVTTVHYKDIAAVVSDTPL